MPTWHGSAWFGFGASRPQCENCPVPSAVWGHAASARQLRHHYLRGFGDPGGEAW